MKPQEVKEKDWAGKKIFEEITAKNFSNLMKKYQATDPRKFTNVKQDKHRLDYSSQITEDQS